MFNKKKGLQKWRMVDRMNKQTPVAHATATKAANLVWFTKKKPGRKKAVKEERK